jgi:hypothetical protein
MTAANDLAVRRALEAAGVIFIDENGEGPGVRLRKHGAGERSKSDRWFSHSCAIWCRWDEFTMAWMGILVSTLRSLAHDAGWERKIHRRRADSRGCDRDAAPPRNAAQRTQATPP